MKQRRNKDSLGSSSCRKSSQQRERETTSASASSLSIDAGGADPPSIATSFPRRRRTKKMTHSSTNFLNQLVRRIPELLTSSSRSSSSTLDNTASTPTEVDDDDHKDRFNYALLIVLYTLQGIPMGLSASIPFLLQDKIQKLSSLSNGVATDAAAAAVAHAQANKLSYQANAVFALCSWPFSLKLLWAPIVDAVFLKQFGRRKTWLIPVQTLAGSIMVFGANFVERQLGLTSTSTAATMNVKGVTAFFFVLYFLMATQDIAVDGWALTMLRKANRGKGPVCNSIGQNIGYFLVSKSSLYDRRFASCQ